MNFGLLLVIRNPQEWPRSDHDAYQGYIDNSVRAEKLGFNHIWTSEHHFTPGGWSPAQFPILAAIAARTEHIRIGTLIVVLPLHNPIRVAEDAATVDILSNGRLDLAVGPGWSMHEYATFGVPFGQRRSRMYEELEIIRRCFDEESFDYNGKYFQYRNLRMTTKPVQKPFPLWVGALSDAAVAEAGAHGYHLANAPTVAQGKIYDDALRRAGHNPADYQRAILQICHVAETTEKAWDEAEAHIHYYIKWYFAMLEKQGGRGMPPQELTVPPLKELRKTGRGPYGPAYVGSPEDVIRMYENLVKTNPMTEVVPTLGLPGMDPRIARNSMELLAKEVVPHFAK